ncbi:MAG: DDE-type integrase/transposase/recombinase [Nitrospira sp.]|nr:DDE-type integrase/transposase/recombinase [Nitrospira sp.]
MKIMGRYTHLYWAVDQTGYTVDVLLTPQRDQAAAQTFFRKAMGPQRCPAKSLLTRVASPPQRFCGTAGSTPPGSLFDDARI